MKQVTRNIDPDSARDLLERVPRACLCFASEQGRKLSRLCWCIMTVVTWPVFLRMRIASQALALTIIQQRVYAKRKEHKQALLEQIKQGVSVEQARSASRVPIHRATIYRLLKRVQNNEEGTVVDGRHGHAIKLRGEVLTFLTDYCQFSAARRDPEAFLAPGEYQSVQPSPSEPGTDSQIPSARKKAQKRLSRARIQRRSWWFVAPGCSQRDRITDAIGEGSANGKDLSPSSVGGQFSSGPAKTPPHIAVSGSGRAAPQLGSA